MSRKLNAIFKKYLRKRQENQEAVYFAQVDIRYGLETMWERYSSENDGDQIILKMILPSTLIEEIDSYLHKKDINEDYIYPDQS